MATARFNYLNLLLFICFSLLASGFQTTFWYQLFGSIPAPQVWLIIILYLALFRKTLTSISIIYLIALFLNPLTGMPLGYVWLTLGLLFMAANYAKKRVFWPGSRYFLIASFLFSLSYQIIYFSISRWMDTNPAPVHFFPRLFDILLTTSVAVPIFLFLTWVDKITDQDTLPESTGAEA